MQSHTKAFSLEQMQQSCNNATKLNAMETSDTPCMLVSRLPNGVVDRWNRKALMLRRSQQRELSLKDFIEFFDEETVLINNFIFSREAITAYDGTQEKSDNQRKRRSYSKKHGSFPTILITINLKHKINAYFAVTSTIWTTVRNTLRKA